MYIRKDKNKLTPKLLLFEDLNYVNQALYYSRSNSKKKNHSDVNDQIAQQIKELLNTTNNQEQTTDDQNDIYEQLVQKYKEQLDLNKELQTKLQHNNVQKSPFYHLFQSLPANYPVNQVLLNGSVVEVSRFINISKEDTLVHFTDDQYMKSFDVNKIDGIEWGREELDC